MIKGDESQVFTFIIDDIEEHDMMLLEPGYDYITAKPIIYNEDNTTLPSLLHWGESDLKPSTVNYIFVITNHTLAHCISKVRKLGVK